MSDKEKEVQQNAAPVKEAASASGGGLAQQLDTLGKYGGFTLLETTLAGLNNVNPERKARKRIFLSDESKKSERADLKERLKAWAELLGSAENVADMVGTCEKSSQGAESLLKKNLKQALDETRGLETSYRSVALFYKNTESDKLKNVNIMNAELDQLNDLDNPFFIDAVAEELRGAYDRLDLRDHYSLLVLPGYLGSNKVVEKWAKIANENKVMLLTDFEDLDSCDDVVDLFESANLTGGDLYRSNVIMTCNWLVGREQNKELGEEEALYVPPSGALAGKIYKTLMSQVTAGKKFGGINEVDGVKFKLKKSELSNLEKIGLVPMVNEYGKVMAFSAKTLFNGDNLGLQTYSVVRVFDYVTKVLIDFLNRRAFENFNTTTQKDIRKQIIGFLDGIKGANKLIEKFKILRFEQDPKQKDRIYLDIHMTPYFPAKNFMIKLDGMKGDDPDSAEWQAEYAQQ